MRKNTLVPELSVSNLEKSKDFYINVLGFKKEYERTEDKFVYMSFYGSALMIEEDRQREGASAKWIIEPLDHPRGRGLNISIRCEDAEALAQRLINARIELRKPIEECWYRDNNIAHGQKNFLVQDPDGYLLRFEESLGIKDIEK